MFRSISESMKTFALFTKENLLNFFYVFLHILIKIRLHHCSFLFPPAPPMEPYSQVDSFLFSDYCYMHTCTHTHTFLTVNCKAFCSIWHCWFYSNINIYQPPHLNKAAAVTSRFFSFTLVLITEQDTFELFKLYLGRSLNTEVKIPLQ